MKKNKPKKTTFYIFFITLVILSFFIITNDFGLIKLIQLKREKAQLEKELHHLTVQQLNLNKEITKLQTNQAYIEKIAREKFMMAKPGEKIFKVVNYKKITQ